MENVFVGPILERRNVSGEWLSLGDYADLDEFYEKCEEACQGYNYKFWDSEGIPNQLINDMDLDEDIYDYVEYDGNKDALTEYLEYFSWETVKDAIFDFNQRYMGTIESGDEDEQFGRWLANQGIVDIPEHLKYNIDYASLTDGFIDSGWTILNKEIFSP